MHIKIKYINSKKEIIKLLRINIIKLCKYKKAFRFNELNNICIKDIKN